jgi:hypothetical protein
MHRITPLSEMMCVRVCLNILEARIEIFGSVESSRIPFIKNSSRHLGKLPSVQLRGLPIALDEPSLGRDELVDKL